MRTPDERINDDWTVAEVIEEFENHDFLPADPSKDHFICDFCSKGVNYSAEPRVGQYISDMVLNPENPVYQQATDPKDGSRPLVPLASYCEECSEQKLLFPCRGYAEVRLFFDLDEDKVMRNVEVTDVSPEDDGIPWDPKDLSERIMETSFESSMVISALMGKDLWGPENIVTFFLAFVDGVDIRQLVNWDGSIDPKVLGQARSSYEDVQKKLQREGGSRKNFRDHVREDG